MRTIKTKVYTAEELKKKFPEGFERAFTRYKDSNDTIPWDDEILDSLKGIFEAMNVKLTDYSIDGLCGYSSVSFDLDDDIGALSGKRAAAWFEHRLFADLRIPFVPLSGDNKRHELAKHGAYYRAGMIKSCPFTGVCFDEDYLDAIRKGIREGESVREILKGLADVAGKLRESENENQNTEEYFLDMALGNEWEFTEDGERV